MAQQSIPRIIHFCWLSDDPFPANIAQCMESWKRYLPDYTFMHWNFERFPKEQSTWVREAFEKKKYAYAADYIRLYALYHHGGIYLDTDVEVVKRFDPLLHLPYFLGTEGNNYIEAAVMGATAGLDWIGACLAYFDHKEGFVKADGNLDMVPLPQVMNQVIEKQRSIEAIESEQLASKALYEDTTKLYLFPKDFFCAKDMGTGQLLKSERTYAIHHFAMSWIDAKSRFRSDVKRKLMKWIGYERSQKMIEFLKKKKP